MVPTKYNFILYLLVVWTVVEKRHLDLQSLDLSDNTFIDYCIAKLYLHRIWGRFREAVVSSTSLDPGIVFTSQKIHPKTRCDELHNFTSYTQWFEAHNLPNFKMCVVHHCYVVQQMVHIDATTAVNKVPWRYRSPWVFTSKTTWFYNNNSWRCGTETVNYAVAGFSLVQILFSNIYHIGSNEALYVGRKF